MYRSMIIVLNLMICCACGEGIDLAGARARISGAAATNTSTIERVCPFGLSLRVLYTGRALDRPDLSGEVTVTHGPTRLEVTDSFGIQKNLHEFEVVLFNSGSKQVDGGMPEDSQLAITIYEHQMGVIRAKQETLLDRYSINLSQLLGSKPMALASGVTVGVECE